MSWYAGMKFPTERFDDISAFPKQVKAQAMTPLCHTSVSKWTLAAGAEVTSKEKYERCAKVAGEVVYTVVHYLNEYFEGRWKPAKWTPSKEIAHCVECHGPEDIFRDTQDASGLNPGGRSTLPCFPAMLPASRCWGGDQGKTLEPGGRLLCSWLVLLVMKGGESEQVS